MAVSDRRQSPLLRAEGACPLHGAVRRVGATAGSVEEIGLGLVGAPLPHTVCGGMLIVKNGNNVASDASWCRYRV